MLSNFFLSLKFINLFTWNYRGTETVYNLNLSNQKVKGNIWSSGLSEMVNRKPRRVIPKRKGTTKGFLWLPLFRLEVSRLKFWERNSNRDWVLCWARKIVYSSVNQSKTQERKTLENVKEIRRGISSSGHSHKETIPGSRATETCAEQTNSLLSLCWLVLCQRTQTTVIWEDGEKVPPEDQAVGIFSITDQSGKAQSIVCGDTPPLDWWSWVLWEKRLSKPWRASLKQDFCMDAATAHVSTFLPILSFCLDVPKWTVAWDI